MIDMDTHAKQSADMRRASEYARGISENLRKLNEGPVFDNDREKLLKDVNVWFSALSGIIGKETQR